MNSSPPLERNEFFILETACESQKHHCEQKSHEPESIYCVISLIGSSRTGKANPWENAYCIGGNVLYLDYVHADTHQILFNSIL